MHSNRRDPRLKAAHESSSSLFGAVDGLENLRSELHHHGAAVADDKVAAFEAVVGLRFVLHLMVGSRVDGRFLAEGDALHGAQTQVFEPGHHFEAEVVEPDGAVAVPDNQVSVVGQQGVDWSLLLVQRYYFDDALFILFANAFDDQASVENQNVATFSASDSHLRAWDKYCFSVGCVVAAFGVVVALAD